MSTDASTGLESWRARVERELCGKSFDKSLVHRSLEGLDIQPLYVEAPPASNAMGTPASESLRICMRVSGASVAEVTSEVEGGVDALWLSLAELDAVQANALGNVHLVVDAPAYETGIAHIMASPLLPNLSISLDPLSKVGSESALAALPDLVRKSTAALSLTVSTLRYHEAGADAVEEVALALATGAAYIGILREVGVSADQIASRLTLRVSAGSDTFLECCKLRAIRVCFRKMFVAFGASEPARSLLHVVASSRTMTQRDPWVNMLRVTTQMFSAILGSADMITPLSFDEGFGAPASVGRRLARNTGLVLREESELGRVLDPAAGAYYFESLTDAIARKAWARFQTIEREGGIVVALQNGTIDRAIEATRVARTAAIAKRTMTIVGVSEFANLDETLPHHVIETPRWNDAAAFEALRVLAEKKPISAMLITLGTFAESRSRAGFASNLFAAGGIRTSEIADTDVDSRVLGSVACLCGTDARYALDAATTARALKAAGASRVVLAGRPGALEQELRDAGVDTFIFLGCDVPKTLASLMGEAS